MTRYDVEGLSVIVTGAGSGIGRAAALCLARSSARVAASDLDARRAEETATMIREAGGQAISLTLDVTDAAAQSGAVAKTVATWGRLDASFNSAGITGPRVPTLDLDPLEFERIQRVNVTGLWHSMRAQIPALLEGGGGAIVNAASISGLVGTKLNTGYAASKFAVVGMTRSVALEYARQGLRANCVCPGWITSPMTDALDAAEPGLHGKLAETTPMGRAGTPDEVAELVTWLCSRSADYVTGAAYSIDGGRWA